MVFWLELKKQRMITCMFLVLVCVQAAGCQKKTEEMKPILSHADYYDGIDYDYIEKNHKILTYNICTDPKYDYENTVLKEYLEKDVEEDKEMVKRNKEAGEKEGIIVPLEIDYFTFDFNADGLEDYLVCYHGSLWSGSGGNAVRIFVQNKDGTLKEVLGLTVRLLEDQYIMPRSHAPMAILKEKTAGFYAIVLPGSNRILRYDKKTERYEFHDNE